MIIHLFDKTTFTVDDERGKRVEKMIDAGIEWLDINGSRVKVSSISKLTPGNEGARYKTPHELGMPDLGTDNRLEMTTKSLRSTIKSS